MMALSSPLSRLYVILLLSGVYWWHLAGLTPNGNIFTNNDIGIILYRATIGLPFIMLAGTYYLKSGLRSLLKPSIISTLVFALLFFMSLDIALRFIGFDNREAPIIHALYLVLRIAIVLWIFGIRSFNVSHKDFLIVIAGYFLISILLDLSGLLNTFQTITFYSGYIDWLRIRYSGLSFNTNMFAGLLLTLTSIHLLVNSRNDWKNFHAITLTILLLFLAIATKGRFGLLIGALLTAVWVDVWFTTKWSKTLNWTGIALLITFIILSVRISIFPFTEEAPYINTHPSFYRLAHEPNFKSLLTSNGIGMSDYEQREKYSQNIDASLVKKTFEQINGENQKIQLNKPYTASHSILLSLPLDYGIGSLIVFLIINLVMIVRYIQLFGFAIETQIVAITFIRYFHQQMSIASWSLLMFELAFIIYTVRLRTKNT